MSLKEIMVLSALMVFPSAAFSQVYYPGGPVFASQYGLAIGGQQPPGIVSNYSLYVTGNGGSTPNGIVQIDGTATSNPFLGFYQAGTLTALIQQNYNAGQQLQLVENSNVGLAVNSTGGLVAAHLATTGTATAALCITSGGLIFQDTSGTICGISAMRFKNVIGTLDENRAVSGVAQLRTGVWQYKDEFQAAHGSKVHVGLYADDVAAMDSRCAVRDNDGKVTNYEDRCVLAYLVADVKKMHSENEHLKNLISPKRR